MEEKEYFQTVLERILEEPKTSYPYRAALESVHRIRLYPNIDEKSSEFNIFLEQDGYNIHLTIEGNKFKKREYSPQEIAEIITSSDDYKKEKISPQEIAKNFIDNIAYPLGQYFAENNLTILEKYLLRTE